MRIFYASASTPNAGMAVRSQIWRNNLLLPLRELGHDVVEFDYDLDETLRWVDTTSGRHRRFIEKNRPRVTAELLRQLRRAHAERPVDLFFSYFYDACIEPAAIDEIRKLGVVTVNWYCNGSYQLHLVREIAPHYDWCLVPEKFRLPDYVAMGARPIYCQEAANPAIYRAHDLPVDFDVVFVGQAYGDRPKWIRRLVDAGIDVRVWGPNWWRHVDGASDPELGPLARLASRVRTGLLRRDAPPPDRVLLPKERVGPPLSDDELVRMYSRARVNLGFSTCGDTHESGERIMQVRLRDFEVPMSGGFYMVERMDELAEFFEIGREIVCYDGPDDLVAKIRHYLDHPAEREAIRRAGQARCLRDHTWQRRFRDAFAAMGLG